MTIGTIILWTIVGLIFLLTFYVVFATRRVKNERKRQRDRFQVLFKNNSFPTTPTLEFGSSYGWPTFTVTFSSKADFDLAKERKLLDMFEKEIASFYKSDFEPNLAISFKYFDECKKTHFGPR